LDKRLPSSSSSSSNSTTSPPTVVPQPELDALEGRLAQLQQRKDRLGREVALLDERAETASLGRRARGVA
ncbi:uncharacterized protein RHOBADRAFT_43767, partial [Rhodotorula graminis WP1]